jgi:hypothetical protein
MGIHSWPLTFHISCLLDDLSSNPSSKKPEFLVDFQHVGIFFGWVHEMIHPTIFWGTWFLRNSVVEPCSKESSQEICRYIHGQQLAALRSIESIEQCSTPLLVDD